ncbi:g-patch domain-containing protein [Trichonephila clavata]|uniref:G-patch domain-containing protein n=1 Tax=Trichonephila clavata TaxID=2740835 RepID=A0A8X6HU73_TRICU|nr:g-patch domain-containing protein [Trichonephila clavata]
MEFSTFSQSNSLPVKKISFVPASEENSDHVKCNSTCESNLSGTCSIIPDGKTDSEEKFCRECIRVYKVSKTTHEQSAAHLLSIKKSESFTFYHIPENNKGFQMMLKSGWDKHKGLGVNSDGRKFPIETVFKKDRSVIGKNEEMPKVSHFNTKLEASLMQAIRLVEEYSPRKRKRKKRTWHSKWIVRNTV